MIRQGRERSSGEIIKALREMHGMIRSGLRLTQKEESILGDAADMIDRLEGRIEELEERADIIAADLTEDWKEHSGLIEED